MKITVDVDCTPDELRTFFGLPDVKPMQEALMKQVQDQMATNLHAMEPEAMFKVWMPAGIQGMEQMQKMLWSQFTTSGNTRPKEK
jgi:hypothetical protein